MTVYGYLRVSTEKQEISNNKADILNLANENNLGQVIWVMETVSGTRDWRKRVLGDLFLKMKKGDTIIVSEFSRIGRKQFENIEFICECRRKGVNVLSVIKDEIPIKDDTEADLLLSIRSYMSTKEREDISRRTRIGLAKRKADGVKLGRHPGMLLEKNLEENKKIVKKMIEEDYKFTVIAKKVGCNTTTLRKFINKYNLNNNTDDFLKKPRKNTVKNIDLPPPMSANLPPPISATLPPPLELPPPINPNDYY